MRSLVLTEVIYKQKILDGDKTVKTQVETEAKKHFQSHGH